MWQKYDTDKNNFGQNVALHLVSRTKLSQRQYVAADVSICHLTFKL